MGPSSDPLAVVDSKLQVHGIEGLRVMDASIMPVLVSGNTHATCVMIAEKGVDFIKQKWLPRPNLPNRFGGGTSTPAQAGGQKPNLSQNLRPPYQYYQGVKRPSTNGIQHSPEFHRNHPEMYNPFSTQKPLTQPSREQNSNHQQDDQKHQGYNK